MKERIENGLIDYLKTTSLHNTNVAALCRHIGISRKTFYYHYPSIETCLEHLTDRVMSGCSLYIAQNVSDHTDLETLYTVELEYWKEQKDYLDCIYRNGLFFFLLKRYQEYNLAEEACHLDRLNTPLVHYDSDILNFYIGGSLCFILEWSQREFDTPISEMAQKLARLVHLPLLP